MSAQPSTPSEVTPSATDRTIDLLVEATCSEQRIALLGTFSQANLPHTLSDLRERLLSGGVYQRESFFVDTVRDQISHLPPCVVELDCVEGTNGDSAPTATLTPFGQKAAALGGLLLDRVVMPSGNLSLVHIYSNPYDFRRHSPQRLSGRWRVFKLLESLLEAPQTTGEMRDIYQDFGTPIEYSNVNSLFRRMQKIDLVAVAGHGERSKNIWSLTDNGHEIATQLTTTVRELADDSDGEQTANGLELLDDFVKPDGSRSTSLPLLIRRAKLAGNRDSRRLLEVNERLADIARQNDGHVCLTTVQLCDMLGIPTASGGTLLKRIFRQVPGTVIKDVQSRRGKSDGNYWELRLPSPAKSYAA